MHLDPVEDDGDTVTLMVASIAATPGYREANNATGLML